ncbi:hypothetical protein NL676_028556 [Syzygium grande]|nr:hypothetical protein NL676_028556 [Syzygium grande]
MQLAIDQLALDSLEVPVGCVIIEDGNVSYSICGRACQFVDLWTALKFRLGNKARRHAEMEALDVLLEQWKRTGFSAAEVFKIGDLISENKKDSVGGVHINSPTSEDHPHSLNKEQRGLKEWRITISSVHIYERASRVKCSRQIVEEVEAGDVLQIEQRHVEEAVGDKTDGQGTELKSKRILIVKVVKKEETEEELENADIYIERPKSVKELYNGESESLPRGRQSSCMR